MSAFRAANTGSSHPFPFRSQKTFLLLYPLLRTLLCAHYKLVQQPRCWVPPEPLTPEAEVSPTWWSCCYGLHSRLYHWAALAVPTCNKKKTKPPETVGTCWRKALLVHVHTAPGQLRRAAAPGGGGVNPRQRRLRLPSPQKGSSAAWLEQAAGIPPPLCLLRPRCTQAQETSQAPSSALALNSRRKNASTCAPSGTAAEQPSLPQQAASCE